MYVRSFLHSNIHYAWGSWEWMCAPLCWCVRSRRCACKRSPVSTPHKPQRAKLFALSAATISLVFVCVARAGREKLSRAVLLWATEVPRNCYLTWQPLHQLVFGSLEQRFVLSDAPRRSLWLSYRTSQRGNGKVFMEIYTPTGQVQFLSFWDSSQTNLFAWYNWQYTQYTQYCVSVWGH